MIRASNGWKLTINPEANRDRGETYPNTKQLQLKNCIYLHYLKLRATQPGIAS
jgi:hypothetical protein